MTYTKERFGQELEEELDIGFDPSRIARWCYTKYLDERELEDGLHEIMYEIYGMDAGPEFEITESQLREIAKTLVIDSH